MNYAYLSVLAILFWLFYKKYTANTWFSATVTYTRNENFSRLTLFYYEHIDISRIYKKKTKLYVINMFTACACREVDIKYSFFNSW